MCIFHPSAQRKLRVAEPVSASSFFFITEDVTAHLTTDPELDSVSVLPLFAPELFSNDIHYESILPCLRAVTLALTSSLGLRALHVLFTGYYEHFGKELTKEAAWMYEIRQDPYDVSKLTKPQSATVENRYLVHLADLVRYRRHDDHSGQTTAVKQGDGRRNEVLKGHAADIFIPKELLKRLSNAWEDKHDPENLDRYDPVDEKAAQIELTHLIGHEIGHAIYFARASDLNEAEPFIGDEVAAEWGFTLEKALFGALCHEIKFAEGNPYTFREDGETFDSNYQKILALGDWPCNYHMLGYKTVGAPIKLRINVESREDIIERYPFQRAVKLFTVSFWRNQVPQMGRKAFDIVLSGPKAVLIWTGDGGQDEYKVRELNADRQDDRMLADVSTLRCAQPDVVLEPKSEERLNEHGKRTRTDDDADDGEKKART